MTLRGDGSGAVTALGLTVSESTRCEFEDAHGRCKNNKERGYLLCIWHRELETALAKLEKLERLDLDN